MKNSGLIFDSKKIVFHFVMLVLGLSLIFYGIIDYTVQMRGFSSKISDEEIIERAKDLGMIEVTEQINKKDDQ